MAGGGGGGDMKSQIIGMAMAEAGKLFDAQGGGSGGSKQDAMSSAATMAMSMLSQVK